MISCFIKFLGRALFVAIFILAAVNKLQEPEKSAKFLVSRFDMFEKYIDSKHNITLPHPYKVSEFVPHSENFIKAVAVYLIIAGVGTLFAYRVANCLIGLFMVCTIVFIHNPLYEFPDNKAQEKAELIQFILNMGLWGISMVMTGCCSSSNACQTPSKSKKKEVSSSSTQESSSQKQKGNGGKKKSKRD